MANTRRAESPDSQGPIALLARRTRPKTCILSLAATVTVAVAVAVAVDVAVDVADAATAAESAYRTIEFPSSDGLVITGDLWDAHEDPGTPFIVLFHQAGWSRGEYREIAPKLNAMGFDCLAVDQRSGGEVGGVPNETFARATEAGLETTYLDARIDLITTLEQARELAGVGPVIGWGSSYSAALVLQIAGERPELVDGVLSFAPGEYFEKAGKSADWIETAAANIADPVFITSARKEHPRWEAIFAAIPGDTKTAFVPATDGNHGSRALWEQFEDSPAYWKAVRAFLAPWIEGMEPGRKP